MRVVLTLEQVVIKEAQRSFTYFHLYGYPTDLVVANRVLPDEVGWKYFRGWYEATAEVWTDGGGGVRADPVRYAPILDQEVMARGPRRDEPELYGDKDQPAVLPRPPVHRRPPRRRVPPVGRACRSPPRRDQPVAACRRDPVSTSETWRRNLVLPRTLVEAPTLGAKFDDHVLKIRFAAPPRSTDGGGKPWMDNECKPMTWRHESRAGAAATSSDNRRESMETAFWAVMRKVFQARRETT